MLMVRRHKKLWFLLSLLLSTLIFAVIPTTKTEAQISEVGLDCYGFEFDSLGFDNPFIEAIVSDDEACDSVPGVIWTLIDERPEDDINTITWEYSAGAGGEEANGNILYDACSAQHTLVIGSDSFDITVAGDIPGLGFECLDPGGNPVPGELGSIRFTITVQNLEDLLVERSIGPFICRAHRVPAAAEPYETTIPEIEIGTRLPTNSLVCDFVNIEAGDYYLEFIEIDDDGNEVLRYTTGEGSVGSFITTSFEASLTLEQFEEGQIGFAQSEFTSDTVRCNSGTFNLLFRWVLCPLISLLFNTINTMYNSFIIPVLYYSPLLDSGGEEQDEALFDIWNNFRVIANVVFVIVFLVAIFGQSLAGFELFSAYDIKKIMPRLVIGIIAVQLSWYIAAFMVDLFNIIGAGIRGLILAPVDGFISINLDLDGNWNELAATLGIIGGVAAGLWVGGIAMGLPLILYPIIFGMLAAFITILIRRALITILIVSAPIAFVAWILPNTAGIFKTWWSWFWKALLVYPLIIALLAGGELFAKIITASNTAGAETQQSIVVTLFAIIALFTPYFFIPFVFRFAGGALSALTGGLDNQSKRLNQRMFGDIRDPNSYRGRRRTKQVEGRIDRKQKWMNRADRLRQNQVGKGTGAGRTKRGLGKFLRGTGAAVYGAGTLTGRNYKDVQADQLAQAQKRINSWISQGYKDRVHAILGDKNLVTGRYIDDGEGGVLFEGNALDPTAIQAAKRDRNSPAMVQAALNAVLAEAAGQEDQFIGVDTDRIADAHAAATETERSGSLGEGFRINKVQQVYEQFFGGNERDKFETPLANTVYGGVSGGRTLSDTPKAQAFYNRVINPFGRRLDQAQRKTMLSRAADYNNSHSPDMLYRDANNGFAMSENVQDQERYLTRISERLASDRDLDTLGPSAWRGMGEVMQNVDRIHRKGYGSPEGIGPIQPDATFDPSLLDDNEKQLLRRAMRVHRGMNLTPSGGRDRGTARANRAKSAVQRQMLDFMQGDNSQFSQDVRSLG